VPRRAEAAFAIPSPYHLLGHGITARPEAGPEEVEEDAEDGEDRHGEDHAGESPELSSTDMTKSTQ
jgi:hypothetical protein